MYVLIVVFDPEIINIQRNNCVTDSASGGRVQDRKVTDS